jgi:tetratricopeptide (TPR) repeat protein
MTRRPPPARPRTHDEALNGAIAALQAGEPTEAERLAGQVLKASRGHLLAAKLTGLAILRQGRAAEALAPLKKAAREQDPEAELLLARAYLALGRDDDAEAALRDSITRRPALALAFLEFGGHLGRVGRLAEAGEVFEAGLALAPDADGLAVGLGYIRLQQGARGAARDLFARVHAAEPGRQDAIVGLARVCAVEGDHAGAARLYRQALALRPDDAATGVALARALFELGDRTGGEAQLRAATAGGSLGLWEAINALSGTPHGRAFLTPSAALAFLRGDKP